MFNAEEPLLTNMPFSAPIILPLLLKSPRNDLIFTAFAVVEEIVAPMPLLMTTLCTPVLIFRPFPVPEMFPLLVALLILKPETETAASLSAEEIVTS
ncbi:hypothetical protein [Enterobacter hormaechei]|uniref:hypothetical protein n=1 Tax=Enterobacter hormaechei TaxID=158836 RepID=UPI00210E098B|nr:hypothetical protein [Enterobacter hormaechei]